MTLVYIRFDYNKPEMRAIISDDDDDMGDVCLLDC